MILDQNEIKFFTYLLNEYLGNLDQEHIKKVNRLKLLLDELEKSDNIDLRYYEEILDFTRELRNRR